jgi:hypothetical protein
MFAEKAENLTLSSYFSCASSLRACGARALRLSTHEQVESRRDGHGGVGVTSQTS